MAGNRRKRNSSKRVTQSKPPVQASTSTTAASTMSRAPFRLMDQPTELRLKIYAQIFSSTTLVVHNVRKPQESDGEPDVKHKQHEYCKHAPASGINFLLTSKSVYEEAADVFLRETNFVIRDQCDCWRHIPLQHRIPEVSNLTYERHRREYLEASLLYGRHPLLTPTNFPKLKSFSMTVPFVGSVRATCLKAFLDIALNMAIFIDFEMVDSTLGDSNSTINESSIVRVLIDNFTSKPREVGVVGYFRRHVNDVQSQLNAIGLLTPGTKLILKNTFHRNASTTYVTI